LVVRDQDAGRGGDVLEPPTADVAVEAALRPLETAGRPIGPYPTGLELMAQVERGRPGDVVAHEQVEPAVAVVVQEGGGAGKTAGRLLPEEVAGGRRGPAAGSAQPRGAGHIDEAPAALVVEQAVAADRGDEHVRPAVVVVIADGDPHAVQHD